MTETILEGTVRSIGKYSNLEPRLISILETNQKCTFDVFLLMHREDIPEKFKYLKYKKTRYDTWRLYGLTSDEVIEVGNIIGLISLDIFDIHSHN